jgi:CheY-like chemotaxis protein
MMSVREQVVLVVDDEEDVRAIAVEILISAGYRALEAGNAVEAIRLLAEHDIDLLFTDVAMPGLSGFALAREAKKLQPELRVMYTTGFVPAQGWDTERYGAVVRKPYRAQHLAAEVKKALRAP